MDINKLIIGKSKSVLELKLLINKVAVSESTVLVLGETGTGKELVAEAIHKISKRKGQFVPVNCAAIPSELLESELFGHEKGAFTGADKARAGRFEMSSNGSLFLDEIGDIPLSLQAKLLRALESKKIQKVGGGKEIPLNLRMVCATHQNLEKKVNEGSFRADLFYRINVFPINVPTLAERVEDIPLLLEHLLYSFKNKIDLPKFSDQAITALKRPFWPGNIRELKNVIERLCLLSSTEDIPLNLIKEVLSEDRFDEDNKYEENLELYFKNYLKKYFKDFDENLSLNNLHNNFISKIEKPLIETTLDLFRGNQIKTSKCLGFNRNTLRSKISLYGIEVIKKRKA